MLLDYLLQHQRPQRTLPHKKAQGFDSGINTDCQLIALVGGGGKTSCAFTLGQQAKQRGLRVLITTTTKMYQPNSSQCDEMIDMSTITDTGRDSGSDNDSHNYHIETGDSELLPDISSHAPSEPFIHHAQDHNSNINNLNQGVSLQYFLHTKQRLNLPKLVFTYHGLVDALDSTGTTKVHGLSIERISAIKASGQFDLILVEADGARSRPIKAPSRHEPCIPASVDTVIAVTGCEVINRPINPDLIHRWREFSQITATKAHDQLDQQVLGHLIAHPDGMFKDVPSNSRRIWLINKVDLATRIEDIAALASALLAQHGSLTGICLASMHSAEPIFDLQLR